MADISLTASMRSNLLSLQNTQKLMDTTQERLSTGNKVNSAIDNPSSYYTAKSLNNRAGDLNALLDSMGQGISTIKAANEGIESITSFVEQAKAVASSAMETADASSRAEYMKQYNEIMDQIDALAKDSGYKGVNLLNGDDLTVTFNEDRSSSLTIQGDDATTKGLLLNRASGWEDAGKVKDLYTGTELESVGNSVKESVTSDDSVADQVYKKGDIYKVNDKYYQINADFTGDGTETISGNATEVFADEDGYFFTEDVTGAKSVGDVVAANDLVKLGNGSYVKADAEVTQDAIDLKNSIATAVEETMDAINRLRTMASVFGNNYSILQTREDFTENLINVLEEGADKLTLADMNEESANMLALQTRQQLAVNSLSLASQAAQSVLKLFS